jgi:broad-specificity NMP kinase
VALIGTPGTGKTTFARTFDYGGGVVKVLRCSKNQKPMNKEKARRLTRRIQGCARMVKMKGGYRVFH